MARVVKPISSFRKECGITLIELMVAVAIVGILASIAYPSYRDYVLRSNRTAATACIMEIAQFLERGYTANFSYANLNLPALQCINDLNQRYRFRLESIAARTYTIVAEPTSIQNDGCNNLTIDQAGRKGARGGNAAADVQACW